jgi:SAM-dependent methyltransferase
MLLADQAFNKLLEYNFETVLDVGCGTGDHSKLFLAHGKKVTSCDFNAKYEQAIVCNYNTTQFTQHDVVWCSHVLEHQRDTDNFLNKVIQETKDDGLIAVTVPPLKQEIVGGHVTLWNAGLLLYRLILCGLDCSRASVHTYDYNISVIVRKKYIDKMPLLLYNEGDIETLASYFPIPVRQGFNGQISKVNW